MLDVATAFDRLETRCSKLGGSIHFGYCRKVEQGLPCSRSLICWEQYFPIERYMRGAMTEEEWNKAFASEPKSRIQTILEVAAQAQGLPPKKG